ncbi:MAG: alanine--tRNA ligase [Parcubacteria group bacterium]|nr:alanine--tRNA ligase [Parcubacteria group bacterium]
MESQELRRRFLEFFSAQGGPATGGKHTIVPSSSLVPDDASVLLTTAGMQQFKPYYTGEADPMSSPHQTLGGKFLGSRNAVSIQKSFRTSDIDSVGDETHLTFFEMLGNFSFGGYFKEEAIRLAHEFLKEIGLKIQYVTVFGGDKEVPRDEESKKFWSELGVKDIREEGREDNFWGPTGAEGPCGPTTELYINNTEVWNIVFNEYYCSKDKKLRKLEKPGVDTGMGLERLAMVVQGKKNIFETDLFMSIFSSIIEIIGDKPIEKLRVIADHLRASIFLIGDGIRPSNKEAGYILRRLIRRAMLNHYKYIGAGLDSKFYLSPAEEIIRIYGKVPDYNNLREEKSVILEVLQKETDRFSKTLEKGLTEFQKLLSREKNKKKYAVRWPPKNLRKKSAYTINAISPKEAFDLYQSYGFPLELINELLAEHALFIDREEFDEEFRKHQEISRAGKERKFGGHGLLLDTGELKAANEEELKVVTRLHTATHLLQAALRKVLGESVHQAGSDITPERTRFDFTFDRKLTDEEVRQIEFLVNEAIRQNLDMGYKEMPFQEAVALGALYSPREKYPDVVKVYSARNPETGDVFSRELCGGPHVQHTREVGGFRIGKQEAVSAGVRRIRGHLLKTS